MPSLKPIWDDFAFLFPHSGAVRHNLATKNDPDCESLQSGPMRYCFTLYQSEDLGRDWGLKRFSASVYRRSVWR
jgi:hypothetical protein